MQSTRKPITKSKESDNLTINLAPVAGMRRLTTAQVAEAMRYSNATTNSGDEDTETVISDEQADALSSLLLSPKPHGIKEDNISIKIKNTGSIPLAVSQGHRFLPRKKLTESKAKKSSLAIQLPKVAGQSIFARTGSAAVSNNHGRPPQPKAAATTLNKS